MLGEFAPEGEAGEEKACFDYSSPLDMRGTSIFEDLRALPQIVKSFFNELLSTEGDIFQECQVVWPALRIVIITGLFESVRRLEKFMIIDVPIDILEEVAEVTASAARMGVRVDWMDEILGKVATKRRHLDLLERTRVLEDKLLELDSQRDYTNSS